MLCGDKAFKKLREEMLDKRRAGDLLLAEAAMLCGGKKTDEAIQLVQQAVRLLHPTSASAMRSMVRQMGQRKLNEQVDAPLFRLLSRYMGGCGETRQQGVALMMMEKSKCPVTATEAAKIMIDKGESQARVLPLLFRGAAAGLGRAYYLLAKLEQDYGQRVFMLQRGALLGSTAARTTFRSQIEHPCIFLWQPHLHSFAPERSKREIFMWLLIAARRHVPKGVALMVCTYICTALASVMQDGAIEKGEMKEKHKKCTIS